jgi:hypothetical protein
MLMAAWRGQGLSLVRAAAPEGAAELMRAAAPELVAAAAPEGPAELPRRGAAAGP